MTYERIHPTTRRPGDRLKTGASALSPQNADLAKRPFTPARLPSRWHPGRGQVLDAQDLAGSGAQAVQMNVYHLMQRPGSSTIQALGGLHAMSGWRGPIFTDSGGFQVYSLIRQNAKKRQHQRQGRYLPHRG
ncbi:MAG: tRNA-guanine transglycosylase [Chloroflexi bacterium]|nr:tRNA-guanine transglycosylase [Chloroflexota bacterium]